MIRGYAKHFGVDKLCAIKELEMSGVVISEEYKKQIIDAHNRIIETRRKKKEETEEQGFTDSNEEIAFIIGYTPGGVAYGLTWEEQNTFIEIGQQDDILRW